MEQKANISSPQPEGVETEERDLLARLIKFVKDVPKEEVVNLYEGTREELIKRGFEQALTEPFMEAFKEALIKFLDLFGKEEDVVKEEAHVDSSKQFKQHKALPSSVKAVLASRRLQIRQLNE